MTLSLMVGSLGFLTGRRGKGGKLSPEELEEGQFLFQLYLGSSEYQARLILIAAMKKRVRDTYFE